MRWGLRDSFGRILLEGPSCRERCLLQTVLLLILTNIVFGELCLDPLISKTLGSEFNSMCGPLTFTDGVL